MTQIITRYFESAETARATRQELIKFKRFSHRIIAMYDSADGLVDALTAEKVEKPTAEAYAARLAKGGAVMLVRAGSKPLSVAKTTREVTAAMGALDLSPLEEEVTVKDKPSPSKSIFEDHRLILSKYRDPESTDYHMADYPLPLISRRKPFNETMIPRHGRMANFILPLLSKRKPYTGSIFPRHARMAKFPIPLISKRTPYTGSLFPRHARMAKFPIPLLSKRKPYTGSVIPRHGRMATVPFPLLLSHKTGGNALIPGGPRMANFPISLLSNRKPYTGSIVSKHGRMASFPIPLLSSRKPYTGSIISKHGRMADAILPLIIRSEATDAEPARKGFSFSKMLGLRTVVRR